MNLSEMNFWNGKKYSNFERELKELHQDMQVAIHKKKMELLRIYKQPMKTSQVTKIHLKTMPTTEKTFPKKQRNQEHCKPFGQGHSQSSGLPNHLDSS